MRHLKDGRGTYSMPNEIRLALETEAIRLKLEGVRVQGKTQRHPPKGGHVLTWLLARIYRLPDSERRRLIREGMAIVEVMLQSDDMTKMADDWPFCGSVADRGEEAGVGGIVNPPPAAGGSVKRARRGGNQDARRDRKAIGSDR